MNVWHVTKLLYERLARLCPLPWLLQRTMELSYTYELLPGTPFLICNVCCNHQERGNYYMNFWRHGVFVSPWFNASVFVCRRFIVQH